MKLSFTKLLAVTLTVLVLLFTAMTATPAYAAGTWSSTGALALARHSHTATLLANGKVLVVGGSDYNTMSGTMFFASAELYDPATGLWANTGAMAQARYGHSATLLVNGQVLVAGGQGSGGELASAELYDPGTGLWTTTGTLAQGRYTHMAARLANGKVLVAGGLNTTSAELYDPATGLWTTTGAMIHSRYYPTATLLPTGEVLVAGGYATSAELYDPIAGIWTSTGAMTGGRSFHTATLLSNGKVLVVGGSYGGGDLENAELYDLASGLWTSTGSMTWARSFHTATLLSNGQVLVVGGYGGNSTELYNPATGLWTNTFASIQARGQHTATLFSNDLVLVAGGGDGNSALASAELYGTPTVVSSVRANSNPTNAVTVNFTVSFSAPVNGVDTGDFSLTTSGVAGASISGVSGSGATRIVSVSTGTGSGTIRLNIIDNDSIIDTFTNKLGGPGAGNGNFNGGETYTVDKSAPTVDSFTAPAASISLDISIASFTASDSASVTGYIITESSTAPGAGNPGWSGTASTTHTVGAEGNYTLYPWARDAAGNVSAEFGSPVSVTVDLAPIVVSSVRADANPTSATNVNFTVTFSEAVTGVDVADFNLTTSGVTGAAISSVGGSGATYTISVNTGSGNGTIGLEVGDNDTIADTAANWLGGTGPGNGSFTAGELYTVDKTVTLTFNSTGAQDGWILESTETSGAGGTMNSAATTFQLGDDAANKQYRAILSFNTAALPDTATITSAVLKIRQSGAPVGSNPFNILGKLWVDIRKGPFGAAALQMADFNSPALAARVGSFNKIPAGGWYSAALGGPGRNNINKTSLTQLRLYFATDDNNDLGADFMKFASGNAASNRPTLTITYTP